jgi:hypothetical protein
MGGHRRVGRSVVRIVALSRGETINAAWLVIAAICIYFIAYRFYALFIAEKVLGVDSTHQTPGQRTCTRPPGMIDSDRSRKSSTAFRCDANVT